MPITPPPPAPNRNQPATFRERMDAFLGWLVIFAAQLNDTLGLIGANGYAVRSGTANAITLTGGYPELVVGMQVRFRAAATNTGATTINLDGLGARPCRTPAGTPLPAGYIRTDLDTVVSYDGTYWTTYREIESGSNANGSWTKWQDGTMECKVTRGGSTANLTAGASYASGVLSSTWPQPFMAPPVVVSGGSHVNASVGVGSITATGCSSRINSWQSGIESETHLLAKGRWY